MVFNKISNFTGRILSFFGRYKVKSDTEESWNNVESFYKRLVLQKQTDILALIKSIRENGFDKTSNSLSFDNQYFK
jgi:hypothetical protein